MLTLDKVVKESYSTAMEKGWWEEPRTPIELIALMHSELSEAVEEIRNNHAINEVYHEESGKPCGVPIELADCIIRIADMCGACGIDLTDAVMQKLAYNKTRPHRHGGKKL